MRSPDPLRRPAAARPRRGYTLMEVCVVLAVLAAVLAMGVPRWWRLEQRLAARGAASLLTRALLDARHEAARQGRRVALRVDTARATVTVFAGTDTLARHDLHDTFGVTLEASRDSLAYAPTGLGYGASNARFLITRGPAVETVSVSRVGRVRR